MRTIKYLPPLLLIASICFGQKLKQSQVTALSDSLLKKLNKTSFTANFDASLATKTLDNVTEGSTYKRVTAANKSAWNVKLDKVKDGLTDTTAVITLADSASHVFPTVKAGWGRVMIGNNVEHATFTFDSTGTVTLDSSSISTNISTTFTDDAKLVIYDAGSGIGIRNMLGSSLKLAFKIEYYTP